MAPKRRSQRLSPTAFEGGVQNDSGVAHSPPPKRRRSQRLNPSPPKDVVQDDSGNGLSSSPQLVNLIPPEDVVQDDSGIGLSPPKLQLVNLTPREDVVLDDSGIGLSLSPELVNLTPPEDMVQDDSGIGLSPSPEVVNLTPPEDMVQDNSSNKVNTSREEVWQSCLRSMGLPENITSNQDIDWTQLFLTMSPASIQTKAEIVLFLADIQRRTYPTSLINPTAFQEDIGRHDWHTHCPSMDDHWQKYIGDMQNIVGEYDYDTMVKPSGPFGAVMHVEWHYPTKRCKKTNLKFGHVVDPSNPSLRQQLEKLGSSINISTSDMIPFRNDSTNPV